LHLEVNEMEPVVERELVVPESPEEVWESLTQSDWLGEEASIELEPAGEVRAGERTGFVEEADEARRLVFWWSTPGDDATRVEIELEGAEGGTRVLVVESRPLEILTVRENDLAVEIGAGPMALALA
jgi:uncharacterized protein YndB with AHSA1/START domain